MNSASGQAVSFSQKQTMEKREQNNRWCQHFAGNLEAWKKSIEQIRPRKTADGRKQYKTTQSKRKKGKHALLSFYFILFDFIFFELNWGK